MEKPHEYHACGQRIIVRTEYNRRSESDVHYFYVLTFSGESVEEYHCPKCHRPLRRGDIKPKVEVEA